MKRKPVANQKQIAQSLGISRTTVSYVLANRAKENRISDKLAEKVWREAKRLNYRPHSVGRALHRKSTRQIGVLLRNDLYHPLDNPGAFEYMMGINLRLEKYDYVPVFVRLGDLATEGDFESLVFREHMLDGLIAIGCLPPDIVERVQSLSENCIWLDTTVYESQRCLRRDEVDAGRKAAQMAIDAGYRELVYDGPDEEAGVVLGSAGSQKRTEKEDWNHYSVERAKGVRLAAEDCGVPLHRSRQKIPQNHTFTRDVRKKVIPLLKPHIAWVCYGVFDAFRLICSAQTMGLTAGIDYGLICCEDMDHTRMAIPEMSRVRFSRLEMGAMAANMLMHILRDPDADCPSRYIKSPVHHGATLLGPEVHKKSPEQRIELLHNTIDDPSVSPNVFYTEEMLSEILNSEPTA